MSRSFSAMACAQRSRYDSAHESSSSRMATYADGSIRCRWKRAVFHAPDAPGVRRFSRYIFRVSGMQRPETASAFAYLKSASESSTTIR